MFEEIKVLLAKTLSIDEGDITPETDLRKDLGADSLDLVQFVVAMEDKYQLCVEDEDVEEIKTVQDIINYIQAKK